MNNIRISKEQIKGKFNEQIKKIKQQINIVEYLQDEGVKLKKSGREYVCLCPFPFHNDHVPSFFVNPTKQVFYCFGCQKGGDIIKYAEYRYNLSFSKSLQKLAQYHRY